MMALCHLSIGPTITSSLSPLLEVPDANKCNEVTALSMR